MGQGERPDAGPDALAAARPGGFVGASSAAAAPRMSAGAKGGNVAGRESRARRDLRWGALALVLAVFATAWFFAQLLRDVEAAEFTRVDLDAVRVDSGPGWVDERWEQWIGEQVAALPEMDADDADSLELLRESLEALPFVAEVGEVRVLWPDGLRVDLRYREPVACVRAGGGFALVSGDDHALPGLWSAPPPRRHGYFPMLAADRGARDELDQGAPLASPCWVDGLSVARALEAELAPDDWIRLGRVVIDARAARAASVEHPGVVLWLEGGRRAYFGRSPNLDEPGELPAARKCAALARALRLLDDPTPVDWELADLRWDQPELLPRGGFEPADGRPR